MAAIKRLQQPLGIAQCAVVALEGRDPVANVVYVAPCTVDVDEVMKALGARWNAMETDEKAKYDRWLKAASTVLRTAPHLPWCLRGRRPFRRTPERRRSILEPCRGLRSPP